MQFRRFLSDVGSNFTLRPPRSNRLFEVVKEPRWANVEPMLLLPLSAQPYANIVLIGARNARPSKAAEAHEALISHR